MLLWSYNLITSKESNFVQFIAACSNFQQWQLPLVHRAQGDYKVLREMTMLMGSFNNNCNYPSTIKIIIIIIIIVESMQPFKWRHPNNTENRRRNLDNAWVNKINKEKDKFQLGKLDFLQLCIFKKELFIKWERGWLNLKLVLLVY